ncbi:MAG: type II toxin-antitoxin system Phd/YefM family antitoxin [Dehalococcoidia bacterium]|nr:type II toxin-antitoxin system Phd/YefM family antitoxin [Dehalococcoidia bacterium]
MEKMIAAFEARRTFGKILQQVLQGERFVVERNGEAVAAVVPIEVYEQWKQSRNAFFAKIRAAAKEADLPEVEADRLAEEAIQAVRQAPKR